MIGERGTDKMLGENGGRPEEFWLEVDCYSDEMIFEFEMRNLREGQKGGLSRYKDQNRGDTT